MSLGNAAQLESGPLDAIGAPVSSLPPLHVSFILSRALPLWIQDGHQQLQAQSSLCKFSQQKSQN